MRPSPVAVPSRRAAVALPRPAPGERATRAVERFVAAPVAVRPDRILRMHRYRDIERVRPAIREAAREAAERALALQHPEACWRRLDILRRAGDELLLEDGAAFRCEAFARLLAGCGEVAVFVLTAGAAIDREVIARTERGDVLEALMLETAAWLAVEEATRQLKHRIAARVEPERLRIGPRLGPGYAYGDGRGGRCLWPLEQQVELFDSLVEPGDELPVRVLASGAMLPKMSRSGLFVIASATPEGEPRPIEPKTAANADPNPGRNRQ